MAAVIQATETTGLPLKQGNVRLLHRNEQW
jgi:hypothetical protein